MPSALKVSPGRAFEDDMSISNSPITLNIQGAAPLKRSFEVKA